MRYSFGCMCGRDLNVSALARIRRARASRSDFLLDDNHEEASRSPAGDASSRAYGRANTARGLSGLANLVGRLDQAPDDDERAFCGLDDSPGQVRMVKDSHGVLSALVSGPPR